MMKTARQLLGIKGNAILSVAPSSNVHDALLSMEKHHVGALLVIDAGKLVGIFSERDYARSVALKDKHPKNTLVSDIMSSQVISVSPEQTTEECMSLMSNKRIRHLPVIENQQVIGVLSIGDLVKETITYQQLLIKQLESYIQS
jgi:CBS domain-containing protein